MGAYERLQRRLLNLSPQGADALSAAARRRRAIERTGVDPAGARSESLAAAVRQAALGGLPESGNPATRVPAAAAWDRSARSGDVAPLLRARGTPVAELVADDLELQLREAMAVEFDNANVSGVREPSFEDVQRRIAVLAEAQDGTVAGDAVRILAQRYGLDPNLPPQQLAEQLAGGLAGQNTSPFEDLPGRAIDSRLERVSDNPFPARPSSLEGAPAANELFEPMVTPMEFRVPRYQYDELGQIKLDAEGNPLPRMDPETGRPTFESVSRRPLMPYRTVDGQQFPVEAGEFTTIGRRRNSSDGNRSPESVAFVLDRGDGTYQLSRVADSGSYDSQIIDQDQLGRVMIENGFEYLSGPDLGFMAQGPTAGEADALGRMLFESMQPGAATTDQLSEVLQQLEEISDVYDGALLERALEVAGFQSPGDELSAGRALLGRALEEASARAPSASGPRPAWMGDSGPRPWDQRPALAELESAARVRRAAQSPDPFSLAIGPPAALPERGAGVVDVAGDATRRARNLAAGQDLLTPAERAALDVESVAGPTGGSVDVVSAPAAGEQLLGPDISPVSADLFFNPAADISLAAPAPETFSFRPGILSGRADVSASPERPTGPFLSPLASRMRRRQAPDLGASSLSTDVLPEGFALDTGTLPSAVPVTMDSSLPMPDRLDVLGGLSDVATPDTPVMNFDFSGDWARAAGRGAAVDATWRNKDYDQPVRVTGMAGEVDGVKYYSIEGSGTAIPENELDFGSAAPPGQTSSGPNVAGTVDVGGVSDVTPLAAGDAALARRQFAELANRDAAARAVLQRFPGWEFTDDLGEIFRRMDAARAAEPAFADLDVTEQFQMASMGVDDLRPLADDIARELAATANPNFLTQSQSVSGPSSGATFSTDQNLPPVSLNAGAAARVRQARNGPQAPVAAPEDGGSPPSETAFGFARGNLEPDRSAPPQSADLRMQIDNARRVERLLAMAERLYETPKDGLARTPDMVTRAVVGSKDFFDLPQGTQDAVRTVLQSPDQVTAMANETIDRAKLLSRQLEQAESAAPRPVRRPQTDLPPIADSPDNVTDISAARQSADAALDESGENADFLASQRGNIGQAPRISLAQVRNNVRRILGLASGDELPLAFRDYDSQFGKDISEADVDRSIRLQGLIKQYEDMDDAAYDALRARNSDRPASRQAQIAEYRNEFARLERLIAADSAQDADPSGANQTRLVQRAFSDSPAERLRALRDLFAVKGLRDSSGNIVGDDGLAVLEALANDPSYGSVEAVLYDVLSRNPALNDPESAAGRIVDESGAELSRGALGPESLRAAARTLAEDAAAYGARRLGSDELNETFATSGLTPGAAPQWLPENWGSPTPPEGPSEVPIRPSFIDRLRNYLPFAQQPAAPPAPEPQVVARRGLDVAEQELAEASTPEEMNAVLARINHIREQALTVLDDTNDPPAAMVRRRSDADGVLSTPISTESSARQEIVDRANELTEAWRRRMEQMQAAESSPVAGTVDSPVDPAGPDEPPVARAARQAQAERASFVPRGVSADLVARRAAEQAARQPQPLRNPANMSVFLPAEQSEVVRNALNTRQQQLESLDRRIAELESDPAASSAPDARWGRATAEALRKERARISVPAGTRDPQTGEVRIQLANDGEELAGLFVQPTETADGLVPPPLKAGFIAIDFDSTGAPVLRERNVIDRRGQDVAFSDSPPARRTSTEPVQEVAPEPARTPAKTDKEILEEFSRPFEEDVLEVSSDEARIDSDIETSLADGDPVPSLANAEPTPGPGRRRATEEYEAEQARKAGKRGRKPLITRGRVVGSVVGAGVLGGGSVGVHTGLSSLGLIGGASGLGLAPMSAAYGETAPTSREQDINILAEPAGSQVRRARQRIQYLTTQNPLPY